MCFLRKCLLKEPGVAYEVTRSRIVSVGFPRHKKHLVGLLSVLIDKIAWFSTISDDDGAGFAASAAVGESPFTGLSHGSWR
jgi:hypothetical protein